MKRVFALLVCFVLCATGRAIADEGLWQGTVVGPTGLPIAQARVSLSVGGRSFSAETNGAGRFAIPRSTRAEAVRTADLNLRARGFSSLKRTVDPSTIELGTFTLAVAAQAEEVEVTALRSASRLGDTAASVTLLKASDLSSTAAASIDDALRQIPGFSLFRRTGSRTANPTSQGVSLRGVGASGASRAVVLLDGVPVSDPFGGWIYWSSLPRLSLDRVEVVRGGGSSLYGSDALGGVVSLVPRANNARSIAFEGSYGGAKTSDGSLAAGTRLGPFGVQLSAGATRTDGEFIVDEAQRGTVDTRAGADTGSVSLSVDRKWRDAGRVFVRGSYFDEDRNNGTALQVNDTRANTATFGELRPVRNGHV